MDLETSKLKITLDQQLVVPVVVPVVLLIINYYLYLHISKFWNNYFHLKIHK